MNFLGTIWNEVIVRPIINFLVLIYSVAGENFFLTIVLFTVFMTLLTLPLTLKMLTTTKKMAALQPKLKELQTKYAKDKQKLSQETFRLYKESGVSPISCLGPFVIQMPVLIGLFSAITQVLPAQPEQLVKLSQSLYSWMPSVHAAVPIKGEFLWMDLGFPDSTPITAVLVAASSWAMQKMTTMPSTNPQQQQQTQMMMWMMPMMFGFFGLISASGLGVYWVVSNIIRMVIQYFVTGWGGLATMFQKRIPAPAVAGAKNDPKAITPPPSKETDGQRRDISKDSGGSDRAGSPGPQRQERRSRDRNNNKGQGGNPRNRR